MVEEPGERDYNGKRCPKMLQCASSKSQLLKINKKLNPTQSKCKSKYFCVVILGLKDLQVFMVEGERERL